MFKKLIATVAITAAIASSAIALSGTAEADSIWLPNGGGGYFGYHDDGSTTTILRGGGGTYFEWNN